MEDELSQLDELIESDILDALGEKSLTQEEKISSTEMDNILIEDFTEENQDTEIDEKNIEPEEESIEEIIKPNDIENKTENKEILNNEEIKPESTTKIDMNSTNLASLLGELLNNKTIEITIKIKD